MGLFDITRDEAIRMVRDDAPAAPAVRVEVLACCVDAVRLFTAALGQWRTSLAVATTPAGPVFRTARTALDMTAVDVVARWLGLTPSPDLLTDLRVMEVEALSILEDRR